MTLVGIPTEDWSLVALAISPDAATRPQYNCIVELIDLQARHQPDVSAHAGRVGLMAARITRVMKGTGLQAANMHLAGLTHDIGKLNVRDAVLNKNGPLTPDEMLEMQPHAADGAAMLLRVPGEVTRFLASSALLHHRNLDGTGYPSQTGQRIPLAPRIVAVADRWDALRSARSYKPGFSIEESLEILTRQWAESGAVQALDNRILAALTYVVALDESTALDAAATAGRGKGAREWFGLAVLNEKKPPPRARVLRS